MTLDAGALERALDARLDCSLRSCNSRDEPISFRYYA